MREQFATAFGGKTMMKEIEQITRQNMAMFERAVRMFTPFGALMGGRGGPNAVGPNPAENGAGMSGNEGIGPAAPFSPAAEEEIAELKGQIEAMKRQLNDLASRK